METVSIALLGYHDPIGRFHALNLDRLYTCAILIGAKGFCDADSCRLAFGAEGRANDLGRERG